MIRTQSYPPLHGDPDALSGDKTAMAVLRSNLVGRALSRRGVLRAAGVGAGAAGVTLLGAGSAKASTPVPQETGATPAVQNGALTVVLVHGAWADGSSWSGVIGPMRAAGLPVIAPANPLRSLSSDSAYIASVVRNIPGPVLLVGHSYGGAVITNAASQADNVVGLVYVAAFIPDEGESIQDLAGQATDSLLGPALRPAPFVAAEGQKPGTEFFIDPASFHEVFCADLPADRATEMAVTQRPAADVAFGEPTTRAAWKTLPSWAVVATADKAIGASGSRLMAKRAGSTTVEVDASHVVMLSRPQTVIDAIQTAITSLS